MPHSKHIPATTQHRLSLAASGYCASSPQQNSPHTFFPPRWHLGPELITAPAYYSSAKQGFAYNSSGRKGAGGRRGKKKKKTKAGKPSCVRVRLVHEYLICDQDLQYMHGKSWREEHLRNSTASLHENTTQGRRRWPLRCDDRGVCVCFVNSPGSHLLV